VDAATALAGLQGLSSRFESAIVLDDSGAVLGSTPDEAAGERLAGAVTDVLSAAAALRSPDDEVARVEVELDDGALFVLRDAGRTIAATAAPGAVAGIAVYDLRKCLESIDAAKPKRRRTRKSKASEEKTG
jgi:hypothetical protein